MTDEPTAAAPEAAAPESAPASPPTPEAQKPSGTLGEALERAFQTAGVQDGDSREPSAEDVLAGRTGEEAKAGPERGPDGKFVAKEGGEAAETPKAEAKPADPKDAKPAEGDEKAKAEAAPVDVPKALANLNADAKAAWKDTPEPVRAEVERRVTELENGIAEHQQRWEGLKEYDALAKQSGTTLQQAMQNYTNLEKAVQADPIKGLEMVCEYAGLSLRQVAEHIMGQTPDQGAAQQDATIRELRQEIAGLKEQVGGVTQTFEQQRTTALAREIDGFAADHPRTAELSEDMALFLNQGRAKDLAEAYAMAERLNPAPATAPAPAPQAEPAPPNGAHTPAADQAQTLKGALGVTGAPSSGSNPAAAKPSASARQSVERAFQALDL